MSSVNQNERELALVALILLILLVAPTLLPGLTRLLPLLILAVLRTLLAILAVVLLPAVLLVLAILIRHGQGQPLNGPTVPRFLLFYRHLCVLSRHPAAAILRAPMK
jgi:hypothetical protein